jgi:hypothetical protein
MRRYGRDRHGNRDRVRREAALLVALGRHAERGHGQGSGIDIAELHVGTGLPVQAIRDMTVFTDSN